MGLQTSIIIIIFAAAFICYNGSKLAIYADEIAERTGVGKAFIGAFLLALATSLPEIVTTISASALENAPLAINNLLGGISLQTVILAVIDLFIVKGPALTYVSPKPVLILSGIFLIIQIALVIISYSIGEVLLFFHMGIWPILYLLVYILMLYVLRNHEKKEKWIPVDLPSKKSGKKLASQWIAQKLSKRQLIFYFILSSLVVLISGVLITYAINDLIELAHLNSSFIGGTLLAFTTSLPEVVTTIGAIRVQAYTLAFANIFGSNALMIAIFFLADIFFQEGPITHFLDTTSLTFAGIGILMTSIYLWGILDRRKKTIFAMGVDSFLVLIVYISSLFLTYYLLP